MATPLNAQLLDWTLNQTLRLDRLSDEMAAEVERILRDEVLPDIADAVGGLPFQTLKAGDFRLIQLQNAIRNSIGFNRVTAPVMDRLGEVAEGEAAALSRALDNLSPVKLNTIIPSPERLGALVTEKPFNGKLISEWFGKLDQEVQNNIIRDFRVGMIEGKTLDQLARDLRTKNFDAFKSRGTRRAISDSKAVTKTAMSQVQNATREQFYRENSDVIKGVEYIATLDSHTTDICMSLHGQIFAVGEGARPPQHYNCRSTTVPVVKGWEELGIPAKDLTNEQMASLDGQIVKPESFDSWLKTQPSKVQDNLLGKVRGDLFRSGAVANLSGFMAKNGRFAKLSELGYNLKGNPLEPVQIQGKEYGVYQSRDARTARQEWADGLPQEESEALSNYTSDDFRPINNYLRYDEIDEGELFSGEDITEANLKTQIKRIDNALDTAPRYTGTIYRGVSAGVADTIGEAQEFFEDMFEAGTPIEFAGYGSGSANAPTALSFMQTNAFGQAGQKEIPILYRIRKSQTGRMIEGASFNRPEQEILFKHGTKFNIVDVSRAALDGGTGIGQVDYIIIEIEEIL